MTEISEDQRSERPDIERYLDVVKRRHFHFLVSFIVGWLVVWAASWILPARYKSSTLILVVQPTMPKNYVVPNISDNLQEQLQSITQQIMSRTRLLLIIDKLHLYDGKGKRLTPDEKVKQMRKDINLELVRDSHNDEITAFRINYSARDPHIAQQVTSQLTDLFINENLKTRQEESEQTTKFIESQLRDARVSLSEQEATIREFKGKHEGELPSQQATNLQILSGLQSQLQNEQDSLNTAKQQRVYFQTLIEQTRSLHAASPARGSSQASAQISALDQQLSKLKEKLTEIRSRYTDLHPDVLALNDEIARTQQARERLVASMKDNGAGSSDPNGNSATVGIADSAQAASLSQFQGQLQATQAEIANREGAIVGLKNRINEYQARLNAEPAIDQQLADLTRGYEQSKANYDDLLKKKNDSAMATSMEQMQQGDRFTMLDPPSLPMKPDFPNRLKFCGIGLVAGLALGFLVVVGFEFFDDRLCSAKDIKALLPIAVVSEIPEITSPLDEQYGRKRAVLGWAVAALVIATVVAGSALSYIHG